MPLFFTNETYNGSSGNINANVGDWIDGQVDVLYIVEHYTDELGLQVVYRDIGGSYWFERVDGTDWKDLGFVGGKTIDLTVLTGLDVLVPIGSATINYLDGANMFLTAPIAAVDGDAWPLVNDGGTPVNFLRIVQTTAPESVVFDFNLTIPDAPAFESVIDGSINRFKFDDILSLSLGESLPMIQIGDKSGGFLAFANFRYTNTDDGYRSYRIIFKFVVWDILQSGYDEPEYLTGVNTLGAIARMGIYAELGNPNSILKAQTSNEDGNIGGYDENFNTGINPYTLESLALTVGSTGVGAINYCGTTRFIAQITGPDFDIPFSRFRIGLVWRTIDEDVYYNKLTNVGENLGMLVPDIDFEHALVADATIYEGEINPINGLQWGFQNLRFSISGSTLTVRGDILALGTNSSALDDLGIGGKRLTFWVSPDRVDVPNSLKKKTSIKLHDKDGICVPPDPLPLYVTGVVYTDHGDLQPFLFPPQLTTEDDTLYTLAFRLTTDTVYTNLTHKISAYNPTTLEEFTLEELGVNFSLFPYVGGKHEVYSTQDRPFNLPPSTDKNKFIVDRNPSDDTLTQYSFTMAYGFLDRWEYWLSQIGASVDFFDVSESNNGLNKDWQHYSSATDWTIRMTTTAETADSSFAYSNNFVIRPFDNEDATTVLSYVNLEDMTTPTALVADTFMEVTAVITWHAGFFNIDRFWARAKIEPFEGPNPWYISSYLEHEGVTENPLEPIEGLTKMSVGLAGNVATLKYVVNTNIIDVESVSLSNRVHTQQQGVGIVGEAGNDIITEDGSYIIIE